jgi:ABC-2 type transport system ATP-binding protein
VHIEVENIVDAANFLKKQGVSVSDINDDHIAVPFVSKAQMAEINGLLTRNNYPVYSIHKTQKDLEKLFLDITHKA